MNIARQNRVRESEGLGPRLNQQITLILFWKKKHYTEENRILVKNQFGSEEDKGRNEWKWSQHIVAKLKNLQLALSNFLGENFFPKSTSASLRLVISKETNSYPFTPVLLGKVRHLPLWEIRVLSQHTVTRSTQLGSNPDLSLFGLLTMSQPRWSPSNLWTLFDLNKEAYLQQMLVHVIRKVTEQHKLSL